MKKTKMSLNLLERRMIAVSCCLTALPLGIMALAAILFLGAGSSFAQADQNQPNPNISSQGQVDVYSISDEEYNAYNTARQEPDPHRRAEGLFEFIQKYPKSPLVKQITGEDYKYIKAIEDEYNAYYAAGQESDPEKHAAMLIEFHDKYPQSALMEHVHHQYVEILREASQQKKYELLESLGEKWLKLHSNDRETLAYVAEAAMNLKKHDKCGACLEAIYKIQPLPSLAREIHDSYQRAGNLAKQFEWAEKLFKMPEFDADYMLRYGYMMRFYNSKNLPKAAEYAQLTLKSADLAGRPDANTQEQLKNVRRVCNHVIASNLLEKANYAEAIPVFKKAVEAEKYGQGYYGIGLCYDNRKEVEEAILYYAAAELMGGEEESKAKARLEVLYKLLHNDTLIGIDKVYKKAKELLAEPKI
jgi:hypothetical protein